MNPLNSLLRISSKTKILVTILMILLGVAFCTSKAHSLELPQLTSDFRYQSEPTLEVAAGYAFMRDPAPVVGLNINYPDRVGDVDYELGFYLVGASRRVGSNFGGHIRLVDGWGPVRVGLGIAYLQHTDAINGSNLNFNLLLGYRVHSRITLDYIHWSNAGTVYPNYGRDFLVLSYRY